MTSVACEPCANETQVPRQQYDQRGSRAQTVGFGPESSMSDAGLLVLGPSSRQHSGYPTYPLMPARRHGEPAHGVVCHRRCRNSLGFDEEGEEPGEGSEPWSGLFAVGSCYCDDACVGMHTCCSTVSCVLHSGLDTPKSPPPSPPSPALPTPR
jgi:hypothetical protein